MNRGVEELKDIFEKFGWDRHDLDEEQVKDLDKRLEQFLDRWEENIIETNREAIEEQAIENYEPEPIFDMHELD